MRPQNVTLLRGSPVGKVPQPLHPTWLSINKLTTCAVEIVRTAKRTAETPHRRDMSRTASRATGVVRQAISALYPRSDGLNRLTTANLLVLGRRCSLLIPFCAPPAIFRPVVSRSGGLDEGTVVKVRVFTAVLLFLPPLRIFFFEISRWNNPVTEAVLGFLVKVTRSSMKMAPETPMGGNFDNDFERDIEVLLREQHQSRGFFDLDRDELNFRSGSAPPTVEGSRTAFRSLSEHDVFVEPPRRVGGQDSGELLSEEDLRSHPAYLSYYYSNENLNPRMPPPAISKEDWRVQQRFRAGASLLGGIGDSQSRKESMGGDNRSSSLFSLQPGFLMHDGEQEMLGPSRGVLPPNLSRQQSGEWLNRSGDGFIGLPDVRLGMRRKSFADVLQ
ncbi:hypothetical protein BHE74_00058408, partial [Ensete ventricosum]